VIPLSVNSDRLPPNAPERYGSGAIALHWLIAVLILGQIAFGWFLEEIPRGTPMRGFYVNLHKSTGLTIALLILFRLGWRLTHRPPPLPSFVPAWERVASRVSHLGLYICMLVMPSSGYIASNFSKHGVKLFNVILLPSWGIDDSRIYAVFNTMHVATSYIFVGLIALHVSAGIRHAFRRDGVFARMWVQP
jgi:cytochrome b561